MKGYGNPDLRVCLSHPRIVGIPITNNTGAPKDLSGLLSPAPPHRWYVLSGRATSSLVIPVKPYPNIVGTGSLVIRDPDPWGNLAKLRAEERDTEQTRIEFPDQGFLCPTLLCSVSHSQSRGGSRVLNWAFIVGCSSALYPTYRAAEGRNKLNWDYSLGYPSAL